MTTNLQGQIPEDAHDQLVELIADALAQHWPKSRIKREVIYAVYERKVNRSTVEEWLKKGRETLRERAGTKYEDGRTEAVQLYRTIIADPRTTPRDMIAAQAGLNEVLGLSAKYSQPVDADERAQRIAAALREIVGEEDEAEVVETPESTS